MSLGNPTGDAGAVALGPRSKPICPVESSGESENHHLASLQAGLHWSGVARPTFLEKEEQGLAM